MPEPRAALVGGHHLVRHLVRLRRRLHAVHLPADLQGAAQEATRVTTGQQEEFTGGRTVTTGIASGIGGGVFGGLGAGAGMLTGKGALSRAENANELLEAARIGATKKAKIAAEKSKQTLKTADKEKINTAKNANQSTNLEKNASKF